MEEQQNVPQPNWTTWRNHSCYTSVPWLSAPHSSSTVTVWCVFHVDCSALDTHTGVEWPSSTVPTPQSPLSSFSSHVPVAPTCDACTQMEPLFSVPPTRHATTAAISEFLQLCFTEHPFWRTVPLHIHQDLREAQTPSHSGNTIPATCSDAATQLSFAEFLESCNLSSALPPRPRPSPTLLLDAASQTPPHSAHPLGGSAPHSAHDISCPTCSRPIPPLLQDAAVQTPSRSAAPNSRSRSSLSGAPTAKILWIAPSHHRHMDMLAAPHFPNPATSLPSTVSAAPAAPVVVMFAPRSHACDSTVRHRRHQVSKNKLPCALHMGSL